MARRRCKKFVPDSDSDFAFMARNFVSGIARNPSRFQLSESDVESIERATGEFRDALSEVFNKKTRTNTAVLRKDQARARLEKIVRTYGNQIRVNDAIEAGEKQIIGVKQRPTRLRRRECPNDAPVLTFVGSSHETSRTATTHVIKFGEQYGVRAKPAGAARMELFVELIGPGEPIPNHPGELSGGRPWYLRSFTRSPAEVEYPMPNMPMLIVYWGRWADATGAVGPWSNTLVSRVEGWPATGAALGFENQRRKIDSQEITSIRTLDGRVMERSEGEYLLSDEGASRIRINRALPDQSAGRRLTVMVNQG
jgi:hypothetical protein